MSVGKTIVVGVTGASGAVYAKRLIECLIDGEAHVHCIFSSWGKRLFKDELGITRIDVDTLLGRPDERLIVHSNEALDSKLASGSFHTDGMVICPCSSSTLGRVASGIGDSLIARAAAVSIKEARRLILVPREMPASQIDLGNMLRLTQAGAVICPASPGFYVRPKTIDDLVDFVVGKLLDLMGVSHSLHTHWHGPAEPDTLPSERRP